MTMITNQPLAYPRTCEMGYLIFPAMSQLKCVSRTRASFSSMPFTERTNGEKNILLVSVLTVVVLIFLLPDGQELIHWIILVSICITISKSDVNYGIILDFP